MKTERERVSKTAKIYEALLLFLLLLGLFWGFRWFNDPQDVEDESLGKTESVTPGAQPSGDPTDKRSLATYLSVPENRSGVLPGVVVKHVEGPSGGFGGQAGHFELISATPQETRFRFTLGGYEIREIDVDGKKRSVLTVSDGYSPMERGCPSLPSYRAKLASPTGKTVNVDVISSRWEEVPCAPPVASLGPFTVSEPIPDYQEDQKLYDGSDVWPKHVIALGRTVQRRGVSGVGVNIQAATYDFSRGVMRICCESEVRMVCVNATSSDYGVVSREHDFRQLQTTDVVNSQLYRGMTEPADRIGHLMIIVPDAWRDILPEFVNWKKRLGYSVVVYGYPGDTGSKGKGKDGIKACIRQEYDTNGLTHVMIIGRAKDVPPAFTMVEAPDDPRYPKSFEIPGVNITMSDVEYGMLDGTNDMVDFDGNPRKLDMYQDVFIGRLGTLKTTGKRGTFEWNEQQRKYIPITPAEPGELADAEDYRALLGKLMRYEKAVAKPANEPWREHGIYLAWSLGQQWAWRPDALAREHHAKFFKGKNDQYWEKYHGSQYFDAGVPYEVFVKDEIQRMTAAGAVKTHHLLVHPGYEPTDPASDLRDLLLNAPDGKGWNSGASIIVYKGHGGNDILWTSGFRNYDAFTLTNGDRLPFICSGGCMTGNYSLSYLCVAEAMVAAPNGGTCGAVAGCCSVLSFPCFYYIYNFDDAVINCASDKRLLCQGAYALTGVDGSLEYCLAALEGPRDLFVKPTRETFNLFGDPTMSGRFRSVDTMKTEILSQTENTLMVKVLCGGSARPGSTVTVMDGDSCIARGRTDGEGQVTLMADRPLASGMTLFSYDPMVGPNEQRIDTKTVARLDRNGDGVISNGELLMGLEVASDTAAGQSAVASWKTSGSSDYVESAQRAPVPGPLNKAAVAASNGNAFDCRRNPGGVCVGDGKGTGLKPEEVNRRLEALWLKHWDICRPFLVGMSGEGRRIIGVRLGKVDTGATATRCELLVGGGIHGNEEAAVEVSLGLAERLMALYGDAGSADGKKVRALLDKCWLYVIPCMNPDGLAKGVRGTSGNIDLDRSFPADTSMGILGKFGFGDSLRLSEMIEGANGVHVERGRVAETGALMRWSASRRLSGALLLHAGGKYVYYEHGNIVGRPSPERLFMGGMANSYVKATSRTDDLAIHRIASDQYDYGSISKKFFPCSGEMGDWLHRYLGVLAMTVDVSAKRELPAGEIPACVSGQLSALLGWMETCANGVGGQIVDDKGEPLPGVTVSLNEGSDHFTDAEGRFFVSCSGNQAQRLTCKLGGYGMLNQSSAPSSSLSLVMTPSQATAGFLRSNSLRYVPGQSSVLEIIPAEQDASMKPTIITLHLPAGWQVDSGSLDSLGIPWRWNRKGGISLLLREPRASVALSVVPQEGNYGDCFVRETVETVNERSSRWLRLLGTEQASMSLKAGLNPLMIIPGKTTGATGLCWEKGRFGEHPVAHWGQAYVLPETTQPKVIQGWHEPNRSLKLIAGWNLVGVPWSMPMPKGVIAVMSWEEKYFAASDQLSEGQGYWIFCLQDCRIRW